jgi:hypothetical protein
MESIVNILDRGGEPWVWPVLSPRNQPLAPNAERLPFYDIEVQDHLPGKAEESRMRLAMSLFGSQDIRMQRRVVEKPTFMNTDLLWLNILDGPLKNMNTYIIGMALRMTTELKILKSLQRKIIGAMFYVHIATGNLLSANLYENPELVKE